MSEIATPQSDSSITQERLSPIEFLMSIPLGLLIILFLGGELSFWEWQRDILPLSRSVSISLLAAFTLLLFIFKPPSSRRLALVFGVTLMLLFFSGWLTKPYSLLQGPMIRGEIILFSLFMFSLWKHRVATLWIALPLSFLTLTFWFFESADGRLLFSDDNPTFLYRLMLLKENFPMIPFYNPLWNAGIDARDFFATGALNIFFLMSPLIYLIDILTSYNSIIALLLFFILPLLTFFSCRLLSLPALTGLLAATLAATSSLMWYRWALQFGTLGFITSTTLLPLVFALGIRFLSDTPVTRRTACLTVIVVTLSLLWTPAGIACLPLIGISALCIKKLLRQRSFLPTTLLLIAINLPWISLFWAVSNVGSFLDEDSSRKGYAQVYSEQDTGKARTGTPESSASTFKHKKEKVSSSKALKNLREVANSAQPLILIFTIPGIFLMSGMARIVSGLTLLWLIVLGSIGPMIKPQLELDRMLVIGVFLASTPAAHALNMLYRFKRRSAIGSLAFGFILAGVFSVGSIIKNRTLVPVTFKSQEVDKIVHVVGEYSGEARVLFSGFMLHDFSGGHLAPLPLLSETPIVASSPVHNLWQYKQVFPKEFLTRGDDGIKEYLDLMNISLIFAHEKMWKKYFRSRPQLYTPLRRIGKFGVFTRNDFSSSYFLEGSGRIHSQTSSAVTLSLNSSDAVVKFNYLPFMTASSCEVAPVQVSDTITFTQLSKCPVNEIITLQSVSPFERWKQAYLRPHGGKKEW